MNQLKKKKHTTLKNRKTNQVRISIGGEIIRPPSPSRITPFMTYCNLSLRPPDATVGLASHSSSRWTTWKSIGLLAKKLRCV